VQKQLFRSFRSKKLTPPFAPVTSIPIRWVYFHYPTTFTAYIWCFVHNFIWPCHLDLRPFDLGSVWWMTSLTNTTHIPILSILRLSWVMCDSIWSHYHHLERSLQMHCVTWPITRGGEIFHIFEIHYPSLPIYFVTFKELRRRCYMQKIAFIPLWRLQSSLRMHSIMWPVQRGSSKNTRNNFLTPSCLFNFYGATMTIKGSLYWSISMLKRFSATKN